MNVSDGFQIADSRNLPKVNFLMLLEYMQENECFNIAEIRGAKALLAAREVYFDTAVGYVEVRREGDFCIIKCRVTPEHKVRTKLYLVTATIDENEDKIVRVECNDCASSAGGCKHAICFAMWLIKRSDEPSPTSVACYWRKPRLATAVKQGQYVLAKAIGRKKGLTAGTEEQEHNISLSWFLEECKKRKINDGMILKYSGIYQVSLSDFCIFNMMVEFCEKSEDHSYKNFKRFCEEKITTDSKIRIAEATIEQSDSKLWHSMRQGRVTASKIHEAIHCRTENGVLVQGILGGYKVPETKAICRGKALEGKVLEELEKEFGSEVTRTGLLLITPIIGASPDGLIGDYAIEIKCPTSSKTFRNYIQADMLCEKYKAQVMLQMHAANKKKGLFCVADPCFEENKIVHKYYVDYDKEYVTNLITSAEQFWKTNIFKRVLESAK